MTPDETRSIADVFQDIVGNVQEILRAEVQLARVEIREEAGKAARASVTMVAGGVLGLYGLGFLLLAVVNALNLAVPAWAAALIVSVVVLIAAGVLLMNGRERMRKVSAKPEKTITTLKEDVEWLKRQTK